MFDLIVLTLKSNLSLFRLLARSTIATWDDRAVDVLETVLNSELLSQWLTDSAVANLTPENAVDAMPVPVGSELTAAGFASDDILAFVRLVMPFVQMIIERWSTDE